MKDILSIDDHFDDRPDTCSIDTNSRSIDAANQFGFTNPRFQTPVQRKCDRQFDYCTNLALTSPVCHFSSSDSSREIHLYRDLAK